MVRAGLGASWQCTFANDFDSKKVSSYRANWGGTELLEADVATIAVKNLPAGTPDLIWGSFPCQDLSLAGDGAGLAGNRSGSFWPFWRLVSRLVKAGRTPPLIVLENVVGTLTSHKGRDFEALIQAFADIGFDVGALVVDARHFVPQSRPRLFLVGVPSTEAPRQASLCGEPSREWHTAAVCRAHNSLPDNLKRRWIWWQLPIPRTRNQRFADLLEHNPTDVEWHSRSQTDRLIEMMAPVHRAKLAEAMTSKRLTVGCMYRRTRHESGRSVQRVEVRFDDIAGCLRTPAGGSSRQLLMIVDGKRIRSRLISARETARLMGLPDSYVLPASYNDAYHLTGDGVVVPVVKFLSDNLLLPHLNSLAVRAKPQRATRRAKKATSSVGTTSRAGRRAA
jgi:DNA (cytosine-5)-methyltransferase 1